MKKPASMCVSILIVALLAFFTAGDADAKRFGGGRSFGAKPSYSNSFKRSAAQKKKAVSEQQAVDGNKIARNAFSKRGGLTGMLGGLALGGLLGALFFGGAFENVNFFDLLVLGTVAFGLFKLFSPRRMVGAGQPADDFDANLLSRNGIDSRPGEDATFEESDENSFDAPKEFDKVAFMSGAESAYKMLQDAWNRGDLSKIRHLVTDKVLAEIQEQMRTSRESNKTEIIKLSTELLYVREVGNDWEASVLYDAVMRESESQRPQQVQEIWIYIRPIETRKPTWFLDGIQQMETD